MERGQLKKSSGFALAQLVIIIIILSILAVYISFKWSNSSVNLYAQAALLVDDVRYTQNLSMTQGQRFNLVITSSNTYQLRDSTNTPIIKPGNSSATVTLTSGIVFGAPTGIASELVFNTNGIPYSDVPSGNVPVPPTTVQVVIPLTSSGQTINVTIDPATGRVTP